MRRYNTYKLQQGKALAVQIANSKRETVDFGDMSKEQVYQWLADYGYMWDEQIQMWRLRKPGTHGKVKKTVVMEKKVLLVRLMGKREVLVQEMENFTLAMEVAGYEITSVQGPLANRGQGFYRIYLKLKVG